MGKAKLTPFAQVLRLLSDLSDGEKATLRDVLRPEPAKRSTKKAGKKPRADNAPLLTAVASANPPVDSNTADDAGPNCSAAAARDRAHG